METRPIKSSLKHVAWYARGFAKVPKGFERFPLYRVYTILYIPLHFFGDNFW